MHFTFPLNSSFWSATKYLIVTAFFLTIALFVVSPAFAQSANNGKFDILFISEDYTSTQQATFTTDTNNFANTLLTYDPFSARSSNITFRAVWNTQDLGCNLVNSAIACNTSKILQIVRDSGQDWDKIVVIINSGPLSAGGDPVYGSVPAADGIFAAVVNGSPNFSRHAFVHELGHTLGLEDEYVPSGTPNGTTYSSSDPNANRANCYASSALPNPAWAGIQDVNYTLGCIFPNWYRSTSTSIMENHRTHYFNTVSKNIINQKLDGFMGITTEPTSTLTIKAYGIPQNDFNPSTEDYPIMEVWVYGVKIATEVVHGDSTTATYDTFTYTLPSKVVPSAVRLWFTNEDWTATRQLHVSSINIDGIVTGTNEPKTYMEGYWNSTTGNCESGNLQQVFLGCNGFFQYDYPNSAYSNQSIADPEMVGYWNMDENSWVNDCSSLTVTDWAGLDLHGKNCPIPNAPTTTTGYNGRAGSFDGVNDYVDIGSRPSLNNQTFTYSAWVKRNSTSGSQGIFAIASNSGNSGGPVFYFVPSGKLELAKAGTDVCTGNSTITDTTNWHHVAVTYDGVSCRFYIDGMLDSTVSWARTFAFGTNKAFIGAHTPIYTRFNGLIDEMRVYNRVLSDSEVSQVQDLTTASSSGLVGYWTMDETSWVGNCSTQTVTDSSGNTNNGAACPAGGGGATVVNGKFGNGGSFNGTSSYIDVGSHAGLNNQNFTYAAWVKRASTTGYQGIFSIASNGGNSGAPVFYINTANKLELAKAGANVCTSTSTLTDTANWHHVVISYNGSTCRFYIDGVSAGSPAWVQTFSYGTNKALIGAHVPGGTLFNGVLDEVRVYSKALSATEVTSLYNFVP